MNNSLQIRTFEEYQEKYKRSIEQPELFWGEIAETFQWQRKWDKVLKWNFTEPKIEWFIGGKLNITENALDRHLATRGNKTALIWEPNDPKDETNRLTYRELYEKVCQFSNALKKQGVGKGDRVCIYLPMIPELMIAVLACARIGAVHSVIFAGFSAVSIADRVNDAEAKVIITSDGLNRGAKQVPLKRIVDEALDLCSSIEHVIVYNCLNWPTEMTI